jgi:polygalacturonase
MKMTKRDFIRGTGFLAAASLGGATSASSAEKTGAQSPSVFNVRDFDAKGDGKTPDSDAVQKALDAAGAVERTGLFLRLGRQMGARQRLSALEAGQTPG